MPNTRSRASQQSAASRVSQDTLLSPATAASPSLSPLIDPTLEDSRRSRVFAVLNMFEPNGALPEQHSQQVQGRYTNARYDHIERLRGRFYGDFSSVVMDAAENDEAFYERLNEVLPQVYSSIDLIRKRVYQDLQRHTDFWDPGNPETAFDGETLDRHLLHHVETLANISGTYQTDRNTAVYAVAVLLVVIKGIVNYHAHTHPSCDIHQDVLEAAVNELEGFPEDVLHMHFEGIQDIVQTLDATAPRPTAVQDRIARRLEHATRFLRSKPTAKKRRNTRDPGEGTSSKGSSKAAGKRRAK